MDNQLTIFVVVIVVSLLCCVYNQARITNLKEELDFVYSVNERLHKINEKLMGKNNIDNELH